MTVRALRRQPVAVRSSDQLAVAPNEGTDRGENGRKWPRACWQGTKAAAKAMRRGADGRGQRSVNRVLDPDLRDGCRSGLRQMSSAREPPDAADARCSPGISVALHSSASAGRRLTFELSGRQQLAARNAQCTRRGARPAVGGPLERRVRAHSMPCAYFQARLSFLPEDAHSLRYRLMRLW